MLKIKENKKIKEAIELLNCFDKINRIYWLKSIKKIVKLCNSEVGYIIYNYL